MDGINLANIDEHLSEKVVQVLIIITQVVHQECLDARQHCRVVAESLLYNEIGEAVEAVGAR